MNSELNRLLDTAALLDESQLREAQTVLDRLRGHTAPAGASTPTGAPRQLASHRDDGGARHLAESGIPIVGPSSEPTEESDGFEQMTEAETYLWLEQNAFPMREGQYTTQQNGQPQTVEFTDEDVARDVADLWAVVKGEFGGTASTSSTALQQMLSDLEAGKPLSDQQFGILNQLRQQYASQLAAFRASPENSVEGFVDAPEPGKGRVSESMALLHESGVPLREASAASSMGALARGGEEENNGPPHATVADLDIVVPDDHPDRDLVDHLRRRGAALDHTERDQVADLAKKHADLIQQLHDQDVERAADVNAPLHEAGIPVVGAIHGYEPRELTAEAALLDGVPLKAGRI